MDLLSSLNDNSWFVYGNYNIKLYLVISVGICCSSEPIGKTLITVQPKDMIIKNAEKKLPLFVDFPKVALQAYNVNSRKRNIIENIIQISIILM